MQHDGIRVLRPLPDAAEWFACFDAVQLNEDEMRQLSPDPLALSYVCPDPKANEEAAQRSVARGLGIPHRIVISDRGLAAGNAEYKARRDAKPTDMPLDDILPAMRKKLA